ncbi:hypothetical protein [Mycetocola sp.]|uniref:hypothetical protein n=1 Tax=Mycetocola sp. TaxID=1871042 RepID=UPI00398A36DE
MGAHGDWTLVRRTGADTDAFFHEMAAFSLARELTTAIVGTQATAVAEAAEAARASGTPTGIVQTITVTTVPSSGASDVDPSVFDAAVNLADTPRDLTTAEHVMFELNSVAVWADPQRHDPSHVNPEMVTPTLSRSKKRWNGTRVS